MLRFLAALGSEDAVAPATGSHSLRAFFEDLRKGVPLPRAGDAEAAGTEGAQGPEATASQAAQRDRS